MNKAKKNAITVNMRNSCLGKVAYRYESVAEYALDIHDDIRMSVYKCKYCNKYHIGRRDDNIKKSR